VDPTDIHSPVGTGQPHATELPARTTDQVVVGDIPALRPGLQPRPVLLARLNRASQRPPVVLTGPWGVGKTQLAAAYARAKLAGGWRLIAWVNAHDGDALLAGLNAVAEATGLSADGFRPGTADAGRAVRDWLEADGSRRLLVFDDVRDPSSLQPFVPADGAAQVLITTARKPMAGVGTSFPVDAFSAEDALALLDGRTGLTDESGASAVAAELGYLPLALDQAAGVIAGQHLDYAAYLAKLRALAARDYLALGEAGEEQQASPGATEAVRLSLEAASAADRLGVSTGVMELIAMVSPAAVRCDLLRAAGQAGILLGGGRRVAAHMVDQALERLNERSLVDFSLDGQAVSVHGLVAWVARGWLARRGRLMAACRAVASVLQGCAKAPAEPRDHRALWEIICQVTAFLDNMGRYAEDTDEKLATMLARLRSLSLDARSSLAAAYEKAGRGAEAIQLFEQTLAGRDRLLGPDDPGTMRTQDDLARTYRTAGRVVDAIPLVERTLVARERLLGADHLSTLVSRNNLASAYRATGRYAQAIPLFEENAAACERLLGAEHPRTLASRRNLGLARRELAQSDNEGRR
jgi:tetratricopeptide (TPR) repeat protein